MWGGTMNTVEYLREMMKDDKEIELRGRCHDCGKDVVIVVRREYEDISCDGAFYHTIAGDFSKCCDCFDKDEVLRNYQPCEVWSRVCGYLRPNSQYNPGKKEEFKFRKNFNTREGEDMR
jgi:anaerobic ribonucleoside-triphosphate reductase